MEKTYPVITISREYGAKGRSVARALSEALDIPWYDKDFIKVTAETSGYSVEDIQREGEELSKGGQILDTILNSAVSYTSSHDAIFEAQKGVILELAKKPCIIVGRCANVVLKEAGVPALKIFLYADLEQRVAWEKELGEIKDADVKKYIEKRDHMRNIYHQTYTRREIGDYHDYDLMLNVGCVDIDTIVEIVKKSV